MMFLRCLIFVCFVLSGSSAFSQSQGIPPEILEQIKKIKPKLLQKPYSPKKSDELLKLVHKLTKAERVELSKDGFFVKYRPQFGEISFDGISDSQIAELSEIIPIRTGEDFSRAKLENTARRIKTFYINKGFLQAEVELSTKKSAKNDSYLDLKVKIKQNEPTEIKSILIESNNKLLNKGLEEDLSDFVDESLNDENLENIRKTAVKFLREERYLQATIGETVVELNESATGALIKLPVSRAKKFELSIFGQKEVSKSELIEGLALDEAGGVFGDNLLSEIEQKIKLTYRKLGFENTRLLIKEIPKTDYHVLRIQINEGKQTKIEKWSLVGSYSRKKDFYLDKMEELGSEKIKDSIYVKEDLDDMIRSLNIFLQNQGYLSSKVELEKTNFIKEQRLEVIVRIDEGPISVLKQVSFPGADSFDKEKLLEEIGLVEGAALNLNTLEESVRNLRTFYLEEAYLDYELLNEKTDLITYGNNNQEAYLKFRISEGDRIKVKQILVSGNLMTKKSVVLKTLAFEVGDYLSLHKINESEVLLQRLGIFSNVDISPLPANSGERPVLVKVSERNPGVFTAGLGVTDELGGTIKGFTGLVYKNLGGSAKVIQGRVEVQNQIKNESFVENKLTLSYLEPLLLGKKLKGRINVSFSQDIDFLSSDDTNTFIKESKEMEFLLEKDFDQHFKFGWKLWGIEGTRRFEKNQLADQEKLQIGSVGPFIELDYRDHPFTPRSGTYTRFNLEYASPAIESSEDIKFGRATAAFNHYIPLNKSKRLVFAYSLRGGYVENLGEVGAEAIPQERMFFLGGRSTIRGFELAEIPNENDISGLIPTGSSTYYVTDKSSFGLVKMELRFPIYKDFGAALFYDGGIVNIPEIEIPGEYQYRDSMGLSFRFYTPVGPVSLEYGQKLNRRTGESPGRFHFSIGAF